MSKNLGILKLYLIVLLWFPIKITNSFSNIEGQRFFTIFISFFIIAIIIFNVKRITFLSYSIKAMVYTLFITFYIIILSLFKNQNFIIGDFIEFFRPVIYLLFFLFPLFFRLNSYEIKQLLNFFVTNMVIMVLFSFLVYVPFTFPILDLFKGRTHHTMSHFVRFSGTFGFPTLYSSYTVLALFMSILDVNSSSFNKSGLLNFMKIIILTLGLLLSSSRTGILFLLSMSIFYIVLFSKLTSLIKLRYAKYIFIFVILILLFLYLPFFEIYRNYFLNSIEFIRGDSDDTFSYRLLEISRVIDQAIMNFPFGIGSNENYYGTFQSIESYYGQYLGRYGFLGVSIIIVPFFYFIVHALKGIKRNSKNLFHNSTFLKTYTVWVLSLIFIIGFVHSPTDQFKGSNLFYLLSALVISLSIEGDKYVAKIS